MNDITDRVKRASEANIKTPWRVKFENWAEKQSKVAVFFIVLQLVALIAFTIFEAQNSANGWVMITKGAAWSVLAWCLGFGLTIGYLSFHRRAAEFLRDGKYGKGFQAAAVAIVCTALALFGVFSNVASKTGLSSQTAQENNLDRALMKGELRTLESEVQPELIDQYKALADITEKRIASTEGEAGAWGMSDTEPDGACADDLQPRQRVICNALNGSDTGIGLRGDLRQYQLTLEAMQTKTMRMNELRKALADMPEQEGAAHWKAMSSMTSGTVKADVFRVWGSFFASFGIMFILGFGWDSFFEHREKELEAVGEADG